MKFLQFLPHVKKTRRQQHKSADRSAPWRASPSQFWSLQEVYFALFLSSFHFQKQTKASDDKTIFHAWEKMAFPIINLISSSNLFARRQHNNRMLHCIKEHSEWNRKLNGIYRPLSRVQTYKHENLYICCWLLLSCDPMLKSHRTGSILDFSFAYLFFSSSKKYTRYRSLFLRCHRFFHCYVFAASWMKCWREKKKKCGRRRETHGTAENCEELSEERYDLERHRKE